MDLDDLEELTTADDRPPNDHEVPNLHGRRRRWNHIEDLDSFFTRLYYYHQRHGFTTIVIREYFELVQFVFVVGFASFLLECVNYPVLFKDVAVNASNPLQKVTISDAIIPISTCVSGFPPLLWITIVISFIFWTVRCAFTVYNTISNWEIREFYQVALGVGDADLENLTWYDVQKKLREVQREQQMCIHKQDLTELDIYHRILRFKNYLIAMVNKSLLPIRFSVPFLGEIVFLTHGMKYNLEMLLFWGPWAPFETSYHLKEDYKKTSRRTQLAAELSKRILLVGIINLILAPAIFLWQILYSFFNYAEVLKREPSTLGMRRWSIYGRLYLRHFNELEHEINARLSRAYRPAVKYMNIFNSATVTVLAQNVAFIAGAFLAVLSLLAIYDEDVLAVEHVLLVISVSGAIIAVSRAFIPDEQLVFCPERLLTSILAHVHYFPDQWKGQAHTTRTRDQFGLLFQYKAAYLIEELLSPFITPIILIFHLRRRSLEIVDFYRNFTVDIVGVGDVCSFAQMDVRRHGDVDWQGSCYDLDASTASVIKPGEYQQAANGKTELSLIHFTHMNPEWQPPINASVFITNLKERAGRDASALPTLLEENPFYASLNSLDEVCLPSAVQQQQHGILRGHLSRHEGPTASANRGIVATAAQQQQNSGSGWMTSTSFAQSFAASEQQPIELNSFDMSLDALYIHELHQREIRRRQSLQVQPQTANQTTAPDIIYVPNRSSSGERVPLLHKI